MNRHFHIIAWIVILGWGAPAWSQLVTTDPPFPEVDGEVTVTFDATKGNGGLSGYEGEVYAHTGVLTQNSTSGRDWKYVKTNWGQNTPETRLERIGSDRFRLTLSPSIRDYYGVPAGEEITHLAFVFRSASSDLEGKDVNGEDIFVQVYEPGLHVRIELPDEEIPVVAENSYLASVAVASQADTLAMYVNGEFLKGAGQESEISAALPTGSQGNYLLTVWAANTTGEVRDSLLYVVRGEPDVAALPEGTADGISYPSDTSAILSLFAPGKEHVMAIGDFNGWIPDARYFMKQTPDGNRFWIEIGGLEPGSLYRFYYLVDGELRIPDPNTELLVDPSWDNGIGEETYPGITQLVAGLPGDWQFSVIEPGRQPFAWESDDFVPPANQDLVIYELLLRDFLAAHDWKTLTDTLDYLEYLGINAIELMPVNEFNANESWGYNPLYWMAPDKYYGPREDLKAFIDECHSRGIAVILDIVFNHVELWSAYTLLYTDNQGYPSEENPWLNPDHDLSDPNGNYQALHPYNVFFDFDHSAKATRDLMDRATRYWMEEYRIDGFRFDLTKGFTQRSTYLGTDSQGNAMYDEGKTSSYDPQRVGFLKRMADTIWSFNPDAYVILEHFCDNDEEKELADYGMMLWGNINHNYNEATMGYHESGKSNISWISHKRRGWNEPHVVGYMESHDEERLMVKNLLYGNSEGEYTIRDLPTALERMQLAGAFFFTIPGPKMLWQFGELGYDYSINYDCRTCNKPIRWDYFDEPARRELYEVWSSIIRLRTGETAFRSDDFELFVSGSWKRIEIDHPDMDVRIVGNFDVARQSVDPSFSSTGTWHDFFSGSEVEVSDPNQRVILEPGAFHIFTSRPAGPPTISGEPPLFEGDAEERIQLVPNPAGNRIYLDALPEESSVTVTDLNGKPWMETAMGARERELDITRLPEGLFILTRISGERGTEAIRFVKAGAQ